MSAERSTPIERLLDAVEWEVLDTEAFIYDGAFATHKGVFHIGEAEFVVYQLNTGQRVFDAESVQRFFGWRR